MHPLPLLKVVAKLLDCDIDDIAEHLYFPSNRERLEAILKGVWVQTNYANRKGSRHLFRFAGLSIQDAKHLKAYKGYLGITVTQHFYARHRIRLRHHNLPCVIEYDCYGNANYYPLELLELVLPICFSRRKCGIKQEKSTQTEDIDDENFANMFYYDYLYD